MILFVQHEEQTSNCIASCVDGLHGHSDAAEFKKVGTARPGASKSVQVELVYQECNFKVVLVVLCCIFLLISRLIISRKSRKLMFTSEAPHHRVSL